MKFEYVSIEDGQDIAEWDEFYSKTVAKARQWSNPIYLFKCCWTVRGRFQGSDADNRQNSDNAGHELPGKSLLKVAGCGGKEKELARVKAYIHRIASGAGLLSSQGLVPLPEVSARQCKAIELDRAKFVKVESVDKVLIKMNHLEETVAKMQRRIEEQNEEIIQLTQVVGFRLSRLSKSSTGELKNKGCLPRESQKQNLSLGIAILLKDGHITLLNYLLK